MDRLYHDIIDASKVWAAATLGWVATIGNIDVVLRLLITIATLVYMAGKGYMVWKYILTNKSADDEDKSL